jgi:hypothetical protein
MIIRTRRLALNLPAAVLVTAALATTAAAAKSPQVSSSPKMLPAYAHGSITGVGPHNGVRLELVAWPKGKIRVGQKVHLQVVGKATSSNSGSYAIHPSVTLPKGLHNLEVLARSSKAVGAFSFPRKITQGGRALAVDGSASTGPVRANIHMMALPKSAVPAVPHPGNPLCQLTSRKTREFGPRWVSVGGLYDLMPNGQMQETYSAGASTTIGVGISIAGDVGSFSLAGTFTQTTSTTEPFKPVTGKIVNEQTPYTFGEYTLCGVMAQVQPEVWVLGSHVKNTTAPLIDKCSKFLPQGSVITRKSGTAGTFTAGVDLKKEIGIKLSAQSGYNQNVQIKYTFQTGGGYLCGSNNYASASRWIIMSPLSATTRA